MNTGDFMKFRLNITDDDVVAITDRLSEKSSHRFGLLVMVLNLYAG